MRVPETVESDQDKVDALRDYCTRMNVWESDFVEDLHTRIEVGGHVTGEQSAKLDQIFQQRVVDDE